MPKPWFWRKPTLTQAERDAAATSQRVDSTVMLTASIEQRLQDVETELSTFPAGASIFASDRPESTFGTPPDKTWTFTGDGVSTSYALTGAYVTQATRLVVIVGGVLQPPGVAYNIVSGNLVFTSPPPAVAIYAYSPLYGSN